VRQLARFEVNEAEVVKQLPVADDVKIVADSAKLVVVQPADRTVLLYRWGAGPPIMTIDPKGLLTCPVPVDFSNGKVDVTIHANSLSGTETIQSFRISVTDSAHAACGGVPAKGCLWKGPFGGAVSQAVELLFRSSGAATPPTRLTEPGRPEAPPARGSRPAIWPSSPYCTTASLRRSSASLEGRFWALKLSLSGLFLPPRRAAADPSGNTSVEPFPQ
jgi:hypothetical protein